MTRTNYIKQDDDFDINILKTMLNDRFDNVDFSQAREDVRPFIKNINELDIWSSDFFKSITKIIK